MEFIVKSELKRYHDDKPFDDERLFFRTYPLYELSDEGEWHKVNKELKVWLIELNTLEEFMEFLQKVKWKVVISRWEYSPHVPVITICDRG